MNKQRRKWIKSVLAKIEDLQSDIDLIRDEEQEAYDNLPEGIQDSDRGQMMYDNIDDLESAYSSCDEAKDYLNYILER